MTWYIITVYIAGLAAIAIGAYSLRFQRMPGVRPFVASMFCTGLYSMLKAFDIDIEVFDDKVFVSNFFYIFIQGVYIALLAMVLQYSGLWRSSSRRAIALISVIPALFVFFAFTDTSHHLFRSNFNVSSAGPFPALTFTFGPLFWLYYAYNVSIVIASIFILIRTLTSRHPALRQQTFYLIAALALPVIGDIVFISGITPIPSYNIYRDFTVVSGAVILYAFHSFRTFDLVPIARSTILDTFPDLVFILNSDGRVIDFNQEVRKAIAEVDILGITLDELPEPWNTTLRQFSSSSDPHTEITITENGQTRHYDLLLHNISAEKGRSIGKMLVMHDITDLKRTQEILKAREDALTGLYNEETRLRKELETETRQRLDFMRALVHELKTPLVPLVASSSLLAEETTQEPQASIARNINRGALHLSQRIEELLDFTRGRVGALTIELNPVEPGPLLKQAADEMVPLFASRDQTFSIETHSNLPVIMADKARLRQILLNLMGNAAKYTPVGGRIQLRAKVDGANLLVEVHDNGPGIPPADQKNLFHRVDTTKQSVTGLGLGLALSKTLVELHGGHIWIESIANEGASFFFTIPVARELPLDRTY
jgi:signal transduction histidine kinase